MIPIGDVNPTRRGVPFVTYGLIAINAIVFFFSWLLGDQVNQVFLNWGVIPAFIVQPGEHPWAFVTLFTSMFLHGGWLHLIGNMLYLGIFGDNIEDRFGHVIYLVFYLGCGLVAGLTQVLIAPESKVPLVGASGAIAGVLGAYLIFFPNARVRVLIPIFYFIRLAEIPALIVLGFWFVIQFFNGALALGETAATGGVAYWAHIGGFVAGVVVGFIFRPRRQTPPPQPPYYDWYR